MDGDGDELVAIVQGLDAAGVTLTVSNRPRHNAERRRPSRHRIQINTTMRPDVPPANNQGLNTIASTSGVPAAFPTSRILTAYPAAGMPATHPAAVMPATHPAAVMPTTHPAVGMPAAYPAAGMPAAYPAAGMPVAYPVPGMTATPRASVETTTGADFSKISKGSQICDDRYTSSYKLAHCQMTPTSPPEAVSEFPPQRREPCRNQGNFEIGGNGSGNLSFHSGQGSGQSIRQGSRSGQVRASTSRIRHNGGSQIWRDRGSSHRYCNSKRDVDAFEHSLRKYPNLAPFRTASTDLIEKLIRYTQAKNFKEMSRSSKSMRSLRNQNSSENYELVSKQQQTYTRKQPDNVASNSGVQVGHRGRTRNFKLYSPLSDSRNFRNTETAFSTSYNYLKAGSPPDGRSNHSDGCPSPTGSKSPGDSRTPGHSPARVASPSGSKSPGKSSVRFNGSVRDMSLSEMSKYIRSTVRQICKERPVVLQVCPKLKNRYNEHKKVCPSKNEQSSVVEEENEEEEEEDEAQASGSVLSRIIKSISGWQMPLTEQAGCQCNRTDCYCTRATQCSDMPEVSTNTVGCSCKARTIEAKTSCSRDLSCVCASKAQEQAYYNARIDEQISEWLKDVPVHSIECDEVKKKRDTVVKELRETLKHLPDDEDFEENVRNEIASFIDDFPVWNPGKDEDDEIEFKSQLAEKLTDQILAVPRKPDRFRDIVTKWVENLDFDDEDEEVDKEVIIDNFVNHLKPLAVERPACDMKYAHSLRKEINELMIELPLNYDCKMLRRKAHQLAVEIVSLPKNMKLSGDDTDSTSGFEENISEWICEHGLCRELKKDPKLIESLSNKLKSQGIQDEELIEKMKELIFEFVDDVETAITILDEFVHGLVKPVPNSVEKFDQDEVAELVRDWLNNLPEISDWPTSKLEEITDDLVKIIQGNKDLENDLFEYLVDTDMPMEPADLRLHVEELLSKLNILEPSEVQIEQAKRKMIEDMDDIIEASSLSEEQKDFLRKSAFEMIEDSVRRSSLSIKEEAKEALISNMDQIISKIIIPDESMMQMSTYSVDDDTDEVKNALMKDMSGIVNKALKNELSSSLSKNFDESFTILGKDESDLTQAIEKDVKHAVEKLPIDSMKKNNLMGQVSATLCKHMNKPIPCNAKKNINDEICGILEKCSVSKDRSFCGQLKEGLCDVVSQCLDFLAPKPVCDFQCTIENDVGDVIDSCPIDSDKKRQLKESIQNILTENGDSLLSEEVVGAIEDEINCMCDNLPMPKDKKVIVKMAIRSSVSKNLKNALETLKHDLSKLRKKLFDGMTDVIEKSPITRNEKTNLKSQLKCALVKNLDSSLSEEEKRRMLDEVSGILQDDMSEENRRQLTDQLSNRIDTLQKKDQRDDLLEMITKYVDQIVNRLAIDSAAQDNVKKDIMAALLDYLYNPLTKKVQQKIKEDIQNEVDEMNIPNHEKNELKSNLSQAVTTEIDKLIAQGKDVPEIKTALGETIRNVIKNSSASRNKQEVLEHKLKDVLTENLVRDITDEEKETIRDKLSDIVDDLRMNEFKSDNFKRQLLTVVDKIFEKIAQNGGEKRIQDNILQKIEQAIDETSIPQEQKIKLKKKLRDMATKIFRRPSQDIAEAIKYVSDENLNLRKGKKDTDAAMDDSMNDLTQKTRSSTGPYDSTGELTSKTQLKILESLRKSIDTSSIPKEKKEELKTILQKKAAKNLKKPPDDTEEIIKELEDNTKQNIRQGLEDAIEKAPIPEEMKLELNRIIKDVTTQHLKNQLTEDIAAALKDETGGIIDDLSLPEDKKVELKRELDATVDENMSDLQRKIKYESKYPKSKPSDKRVPDIKALERETKSNIVQGLANLIDEAPITKQEKMELNEKLRNLTTKHLKNQLSDDIAIALKDDINEIVDDINLPRDKKNQLKQDLTGAVEKDMSNFLKQAVYIDNKYPQIQRRSSAGTTKRAGRRLTPIQEVDETKVGDNILKGIEKIIQESAIPEAKKNELKKRLQTTVTENWKRPVTDGRKSENETKGNIQQGLEKVIDDAPISREKKMELKKKLKELLTKHLKKTLSDNVVDDLKDDMNEVIEDLNLPRDKKDKLKREIAATVDGNMSNFRQTQPKSSGKSDVKELEKQTKINIEDELDRLIDEAFVPKEIKRLLKERVKDVSSKYFQKPLSDNVIENLKDDMNEVIEDLNLPRDKKDKLKREIAATVDENMTNFHQTQLKSSGKSDIKELEKQTKINIADELDRLIEEAFVPKETKRVLKERVKDVSRKYFQKPLSDNIVDDIIEHVNEVVEDLNLPRDKKDKLKREIAAAVDENMNNFQTKAKSSGKSDVKELEKQTKVNIEDELDRLIDRAAIPKETKLALKKKVKDVFTKSFQKPLSDNVEDLKDDMNEVVEDLNLPRDKRDKLKREIAATVDENMSNFHQTQPKSRGKSDVKELEKQTKINIADELDRLIDRAAIPKETKLALKKKVKDLLTNSFQKPLSDNVVNDLKDDVNEVVEDLNLPRDKKDKLKREIAVTVDENMSNFHQTEGKSSGKSDIKELEKQIKINIEDELDRLIDRAAIPKETKLALNKKVKDVFTKSFRKPLSDNADDLKDDINEVVGDLNLPKDKKDKLKREINATVDENMSNFQNKAKSSGKSDVKELEKETKINIADELDRLIEEAFLPKEIKRLLKERVKDVSSKYFHQTLSDNVVDNLKDDMNEVINDLNLPRDKKDKLKREIAATIDKNMRNFLQTQPKSSGKSDVKELEKQTKINIEDELDRLIDRAAIPKETKIALKKKVKGVFSKSFQKPLADNADDLKDDINDVVEDLKLPRDKKDKLKREIAATVDENMSNFQTKAKSSEKSDVKELEKQTKINIEDELDKLIDRAAIPKETKLALKKKMKDLFTNSFQKPLSDNVIDDLKDDMNEVIEDLNLPRDKKDKLKREIAATVNENMNNFHQTQPKASGKSDVKELEKQTKINIADELDRLIDRAAIPKETKLALKKKVNDLFTKSFQKPLSDNVVDDLKDDMNAVVEDLNLPKDKKDKMKREIAATVDENMSNFQTKAKSSGKSDMKELEKQTKISIEDELDKLIDRAAISKETKLALKKKMKDLFTKSFQKPLSDNVDDLKDDINEFIEDLNLSRDKKDKLKREIAATVDENMSNFHQTEGRSSGKSDVKELEKQTKVNIADELDRLIDEAFVPKETKRVLKKTVKDVSRKHFQKPLSDNVVEDLKDDMNDVVENLNLPRDKKDKLKREIAATVDANMSNFQNKAKSSGKSDVKELEKQTKINIADELDRLIDRAAIPKETKIALKKKVKGVFTESFQKPLSDNVDDLKDDINEVVEDLNLPKDKKDKLKLELNATFDDNMDKLQRKINKNDSSDSESQISSKIKRGLKPIEESTAEDQILETIEELGKEGASDILQSHEKTIDREKIPEEVKTELKKKLKELTIKHFMNPVSDDFAQGIKDDMVKVIDDMNLPKNKKDRLKVELTAAVDENIRDLLRRLNLKKLAQEFDHLMDIALNGGDLDEAKRKLIEKLMREHNLTKAVANALAQRMIAKARKMAAKEILRDLFHKYNIDPNYEDQLAEEFNKLLDIAFKGGNLEEALKKLIKKLMRDLNLSQAEATALADEMIAEARKMAAKEILKDLVHKYKIHPSYEDQLAEEFNKLLDIAHKGGDFIDARKKLIKKLMRDLNLSEAEATALADELIARAKHMALKDSIRDILEKHEVDPKYEDELTQEFGKLLEIVLNGEEIDDARRKLIKKLMRDLNLSEARATALADDLISRAQQISINNKAKDKTSSQKRTKETFAKAISEAVDESSVNKSDKPGLKDKLLNKLKEIIDKKSDIHEGDVGSLKEEVLKECNKIVDESSIPTNKKVELKSLLREKLDKAFEENEGNKEAKSPGDYKDIITGYVTRWMNSLPIDLEPTLAATIADNIAGDILDRHKYLQTHPEAKSSEKDEIENLKYQVFRRMHRYVDSKAIPKIMERTPELYNTIRKVKPPQLEPKKPPVTKRDTKTPELYSTIKKVKLPQPEPKKPLVKKQDTKTGDDKIPSAEEVPKTQDEMKKLEKAFEKSVNEAVEQSSLSPKDKEILKNRLLKELRVTSDGDKSPDAEDKATKDLKKAEKYDVGPSDAIDKTPTAQEYRNKIAECVKTWLGTLPIEIDPKTAAELTKQLTDDILDRQKYLKTHQETVPTDKDEIENLMYHVFRRMKDIVDADKIPDIMKRTEDLYNMIMNIKKPEESAKEQSTNKRQRESSPKDMQKMKTSSALSTSNINYSLKELIARTKGVRKQWARNLDDVANKLPKLRNDTKSKDTLALYDETGQIDVLSAASRTITGRNTDQEPKSKKQFVPKHAPKNNKGKTRLTKIEEAFAFNNTTKQNSPFNPKQKKMTEKDYSMLLNDIVKNWLENTKVDIPLNEKNRIVDDLVTDVIERHKYFQDLNITTRTRSDDIEFLKLQLHRRLKALVPPATLKKIIEVIEELETKIETVPVPIMVAPSKSPAPSGPQKRKVTKLSNTEFSPGQTSTPNKASGSQTGQDAPEEFVDKVTDAINTWMNSVPIDIEPELKANVVNDLANDIVDRQKYLQLHPEKAVLRTEEIENLIFQVFKRLNAVTDDESETPDFDKIEELYRMVYGDGRRKSLTPKQAQEFQTALGDEIANVLNDYNICCERRDLLANLTSELAKLGKSNADQDEIIDNLIDAIRRITHLSDCITCDDEVEDLAYKLLARTKKLIARIQSNGVPVKRRDFREAIMKDIGDVFHECPMSAEKRKMMESQLAEDYAKDLGIPLEDSEATISGAGHYGMSFNGLSNFIDTWLSSIHTEDDETKGEGEINDKKKDMANSLIHKIGEMNIDPEIFNDDALYEAVLREELENMLGDITITDEDIQALKEDLISKVLEAKKRAHDEFAGQAYKRKLRDTISSVLPEQTNLSKEDRATIETLKDQLADAYIDLHFTGNNDLQREKLKRKIANELNRFCKDYMNRIPCSPLNSQKINQDLYTALNNVSLPFGDSIRYEVEQARIREEINDWIRELPIQPQNPSELQTRNKMVYVLAKKLFDIEVEGNDAKNDQMREEIVKFLNRLPLETEEYYETLADKLIDKLTATEESRKYIPSSNVTLDEFGNVSMDAPVCPGRKPISDRRKATPGLSSSPDVCARPTCKPLRAMPPCALSPEDKEHLERIRRRTCLSPSYVRSIVKNDNRKTCPGPKPVDVGSQTVLKPLGYETLQSPVCPSTNERKTRTCPGQPAKCISQGKSCGKEKPQKPPVSPPASQKAAGTCPGLSRSPQQSCQQLRRHTISSSNIYDGEGEVQPQIVIKQYYWNPNDKNNLEESDIPQGRGNRGQTDPSPSHQTGQTKSGKIRQSSYAQCSPPPCHRPSFSKIQEQDTGPPRVPCEFLTSPDPKSQRQPPSSYFEQQKSFQRPSTREMQSSRPPYVPTPCMPSPCMSPYGLDKQPGNLTYSKRDNEYRMPKRDGLDHVDQMPCSSSRPSRKERVIELGSLDDLCNGRPKKRHNDGNSWPFQEEEEEEEEDNFWTSPIRRVIVNEGIDDSVVMEREQREERIRCKCKERLVPKCQAGRSPLGNCPSQQFQGNEDGQNLNKCTKCCGHHCPYPSFLYFRK